MTTRTITRAAALSMLSLAACTQRKINPEPVTIMRNGERVPDADSRIAEARDRVGSDQQRTAWSRDWIMAAAMTGCTPDVCAAVTRGEVALGMNEAQLMAATRTTPAAWSVRHSGSAAVYTSAMQDQAPRDMVAPVALVQVQDGRVASFAYNEPSGMRIVQKTGDATATARAAAAGAALVQQGDEAVVAGNANLALARYDQASVLLPNDPTVQYKIATLLDQQLRPVEALMRYQRFLHQMELERINAVGDAYAKQAEAIAHAKERIVVLEKH
jgi:hypothetical protein